MSEQVNFRQNDEIFHHDILLNTMTSFESYPVTPNEEVELKNLIPQIISSLTQVNQFCFICI